MQLTTYLRKIHDYGWQLTKNDTIILKGLSIATIVMHNFFHVFPLMAIENEFDFKPERFHFFIQNLTWNPFKLVPLFFSYFGHLGVQIFIFLSAYGLAMSNKNKNPRFGNFIWTRISKIYPAFFLGICVFIILKLVTSITEIDTNFILDCFLRLAFISNFFPGRSFTPCGPWWFYSMIVQFYFLFPVLRYLMINYGGVSLLLISLTSVFLQFIFNDVLIEKGWFLKTTVFGHLPLISLGLYYGGKGKIQIPFWLLLLACMIFLTGNMYKPLWYLSQVSIGIVILYSYFLIKNILKGQRHFFLSRLLFFIGTVSMYLFVVNGFLRHPFVLKIIKLESFYKQLLIVLMYPAFVLLIALILRFFEKQMLGNVRILKTYLTTKRTIKKLEYPSTE